MEQMELALVSAWDGGLEKAAAVVEVQAVHCVVKRALAATHRGDFATATSTSTSTAPSSTTTATATATATETAPMNNNSSAGLFQQRASATADERKDKWFDMSAEDMPNAAPTVSWATDNATPKYALSGWSAR